MTSAMFRLAPPSAENSMPSSSENTNSMVSLQAEWSHSPLSQLLKFRKTEPPALTPGISTSRTPALTRDTGGVDDHNPRPSEIDPPVPLTSIPAIHLPSQLGSPKRIAKENHHSTTQVNAATDCQAIVGHPLPNSNAYILTCRAAYISSPLPKSKSPLNSVSEFSSMRTSLVEKLSPGTLVKPPLLTARPPNAPAALIIKSFDAPVKSNIGESTDRDSVRPHSQSHEYRHLQLRSQNFRETLFCHSEFDPTSFNPRVALR